MGGTDVLSCLCSFGGEAARLFAFLLRIFYHHGNRGDLKGQQDFNWPRATVKLQAIQCLLCYSSTHCRESMVLESDRVEQKSPL